MLNAAFCIGAAYGRHRYITTSAEGGSGYTKTRLNVVTKTLLVMKLTFLLLTVAFLNVSATGVSQTVTFSGRNIALPVIFEQVKKQTGFVFFYDDALISKAKPVTVEANSEKLTSFLNRIFQDQPLTFNIIKNGIVVMEKPGGYLITLPIDSPPIKISGTVVGLNNQPLAGATVRVKGKNITVVSDGKGYFELSAEEGSILIVSYVGFKVREFKVTNTDPVNINMVQIDNNMDTAVIYSTGYQDLNKERATGSFVHIDNKLFNRRVGSKVLDRIQDVSPGLLYVKGGAYNRSGESVNSPLDEIQIRGVSTINASQRPLLVVDNFIYEGDPNVINPNDVESVTILKDAAAASIWGVRAGNGVIVITTKRGKFNKPIKVNINANVTVSEKPDLLGIPSIPSRDIVALERKRFNEGFYDYAVSDSYFALTPVVEILAKQKAGTISVEDAEAQLEKLAGHDIRNDINKYLFQFPVSQQYSFNLSGGSNNYSYYGSVGYDKQISQNVNEKNDRISLRFSNNWKPQKKLDINAQINYTQSGMYDNNNSNPENLLYIRGIPYLMLADEKGNALPIPGTYKTAYTDTVNFPGKLDWRYVPLNEASNGNYRILSDNFGIQGSINYQILDGLKAAVGYQWQKNIQESVTINSLETFETRNLINEYLTTNAAGRPLYPYPLGATYQQTNGSSISWSLRTQLNFNRKIGQHHEIAALAGAERREAKMDNIFMPKQYGYDAGTNTFRPTINGDWLIRPTNDVRRISNEVAGANGRVDRYGSYFANASYTYSGKYTLSGSARVDESNFFGVKANDRKTPLWSTGLLWNIASENFYKIHWLPELNLRATYGFSGNVNSGESPFARGRYSSSPALTGLNYILITSAPNPQLKWELVKQINIGINYGTRNHRISGSIDVYQKRGLNLISGITVDPTSGFDVYTGNNSSISGRGIDVMINTRNLTGAIKWNTVFNISHNKEKVTSYTVELPKEGAVFIGGGYPMAGKPLGYFYSFKWAGLNPENGISRFYVNGKSDVASFDNVYNAKLSDMVYSGNIVPSVFGLLLNEVSYKDITLSINVTYQFGHYFRRKTFDGELSVLWDHKDYLQAWKTPGDENKTNVPAFSDYDYYTDLRYTVYQNSDLMVEKGDHVRLRDIRLSYEINWSAFRKLPIEYASIYFYLNNIGVIWKASKYDVDTQNGTTIYRTPRTIAVGISLGF